MAMWTGPAGNPSPRDVSPSRLAQSQMYPDQGIYPLESTPSKFFCSRLRSRSMMPILPTTGWIPESCLTSRES